MRVDLYTFIHKAQRFHMFRLSESIGATDFSETAEANAIAKQVLELVEHLKDHARNEKTYIHPLFQTKGSVRNHFDHEHENLEVEIQKIENVIHGKHWNDLYSTYTKFLGSYLLHLDEEEAAQRDLLWKHYEDKDLAAVFHRFKTERLPHLAKADFEFMLPALNIPELTQMFRGLKASASGPVFQNACDTAVKILAKNKWEKILAEL